MLDGNLGGSLTNVCACWQSQAMARNMAKVATWAGGGHGLDLGGAGKDYDPLQLGLAHQRS